MLCLHAELALHEIHRVSWIFYFKELPGDFADQFTFALISGNKCLMSAFFLDLWHKFQKQMYADTSGIII